jgi:hypothetical protein
VKKKPTISCSDAHHIPEPDWDSLRTIPSEKIQKKKIPKIPPWISHPQTPFQFRARLSAMAFPGGAAGASGASASAPPRLVLVPGPEIQELMLAAAQCHGRDRSFQETMEKIMGKSWENHGKIMGKSLENNGKIIGT